MNRLILLILIAVVGLALVPPPSNTRGEVYTLGGQAHYVIVREAVEESRPIKGVHFNIFPIGHDLRRDFAITLVRDLSRKGFTNILFFVSPGASTSVAFQEVLSVAKALGMRILIRFNVPFGGDLPPAVVAWDSIADEAVFYHREFGVETFQFLNEADATQDWAWGHICSRPGEWSNLWGVNVALACAWWDETGDIAAMSHNHPLIPVQDWYWENMYRVVPGYTALGLYTANRIHAIIREAMDVAIGARGVPGYAQPSFNVVIPPIVDDTHLEEYYTGFFAYWTSRRSGAWGLPIGGLGLNELPGWVTPVVAFHIYSPEGIPAICSNSGAGVFESASSVVAEAVERTNRVRAVAAQSEYGLNLTTRNFVVSEAGPSPEIIRDACGPSTRIPDNIAMWARVAALLGEQQGAPPLMVWTGTMFALPDIPPSGSQEYWESTALYPYERCTHSIVQCLAWEP